ncbi:MAG: DUF2079 domain-containing protein, partial [Candidatus Eisenbacteria bacterium]|nr:DUF2079 domain-containing protein [Candidatus Eisenbacteria bacterium]
RLAARIPDGEGVVATDALAPHLAHRRKLRVYRNSAATPPAEWIFLAVHNRRDQEQPWETLRQIGHWTASGEYGVAAYQDSLLLLKRGAPNDAGAFAALARYAARDYEIDLVDPPGRPGPSPVWPPPAGP